MLAERALLDDDDVRQQAQDHFSEETDVSKERGEMSIGGAANVSPSFQELPMHQPGYIEAGPKSRQQPAERLRDPNELPATAASGSKRDERLAVALMQACACLGATLLQLIIFILGLVVGYCTTPPVLATLCMMVVYFSIVLVVVGFIVHAILYMVCVMVNGEDGWVVAVHAPLP
jgi:ribose/xylose/arabinose/galactoside ABC-type transport system permease subunit